MKLANNYYKNQNNISSYDKKYLGGKSYYDDLFDESFIKLSIRVYNIRVLEVEAILGISKNLKNEILLINRIFIKQSIQG